MKNKKNVKTALALVTLAVLCTGSFFAVKSLNKQDAVTAPVTTVLSTIFNSTTHQTTQQQTYTLPTATTQPTTSQIFTTDATTEEKTTAQTTRETTTTTKPETTYDVSSKVQSLQTPVSQENAQDYIEEASKYSKGFLGYLFDPKGNFFYTSSDPWQRQFGFNKAYDVGAAFVVFYYDTMRCKFPYAGKDWLIQFWKGQYGFVFIGGEIGVYNKPQDREVEHYDCASDEDALYMSLEFYRKGEKLLERDYMKYWWCTGFVPGMLDNFADRSELMIRARITMKDYKMLLEFCNALKGNGKEFGVNYATSGLDVFIEW